MTVAESIQALLLWRKSDWGLWLFPLVVVTAGGAGAWFLGGGLLALAQRLVLGAQKTCQKLPPEAHLPPKGNAKGGGSPLVLPLVRGHFLSRFLVKSRALIEGTFRWTRMILTFSVVVMGLALFCNGLAAHLSQSQLVFPQAPIDLLKRVEAGLRTVAYLVPKIFFIGCFAVWFAHVLKEGFSVAFHRAMWRGHSSRGQVRRDTLTAASGYVVNVLVFVVVSLTVLQSLGINMGAILATAGVASIAIGLGAQTLVRDVLTGFFILLEDQFAVGDYVVIDNREGYVESMTLRVTRFRSVDGSLHVFPNGEIRSVQNHTSRWAQVDFEVWVAVTGPVEYALTVLKEEANLLWHEMPEDILEEPEMLGLDKIVDGLARLRLFLKTQPKRQWPVRRAMNLRVVQRFREEGIPLPRPQRDIWVRTPPNPT